jgi:hypothetical protein
MSSKIPAKLTLTIETISGQGISAQPILTRLKALKEDLESKGYGVTITIGGHDLSEFEVISMTPPGHCIECEGKGCEWCNGTGRVAE